jgi:hypothetical protein
MLFHPTVLLSKEPMTVIPDAASVKEGRAERKDGLFSFC